jgi:hypothetical protein
MEMAKSALKGRNICCNATSRVTLLTAARQLPDSTLTRSLSAETQIESTAVAARQILSI